MTKTLAGRLLTLVALPGLLLLSGCPPCNEPCSLKLALPLTPAAAATVVFTPPVAKAPTFRCTWDAAASGGKSSWTCDPPSPDPPLLSGNVSGRGEAVFYHQYEADKQPWQLTVSGPNGSIDTSITPLLDGGGGRARADRLPVLGAVPGSRTGGQRKGRRRSSSARSGDA